MEMSNPSSAAAAGSVPVMSMTDIQNSRMAQPPPDYSSAATGYAAGDGSALRSPPSGRPAPRRAKFDVGQKVSAQFSGDGKWYSAVIEGMKDGQYLVRYPDFQNDSEWLSQESLR